MRHRSICAAFGLTEEEENILQKLTAQHQYLISVWGEIRFGGVWGD